MDINAIGSSNLVINYKEEKFDDQQIKKDDFSKYFNEKSKELSTKFGITLNKKEISEKLGISYELFRKIINREKPTKKRDCIIAVCALLGLDTHDTNKALRMNYMLKLDDRNGRDELIMSILDNHRIHYQNQDIDELDYDPDIISEVNQILSDNVYPPLDIINHRKKPNDNDENANENKYPYKLVKNKHTECLKSTYKLYTRPETFCKKDISYFLNDNSVINENSIYACMEFDNNGERIAINIIVSGDYHFNNELYYLEKGTGFTKEYKVYKTIEDTDEFRSSFEELRESAYEELKKSDAVLNDTKNFIHRVCTAFKDGDLHLYIEIFNFDIPQFNEYYLLDYCNGKYDMTVSNKSRLMRVFLPPEVYRKKYDNIPDKIIAEYDHENGDFRVFPKNTHTGDSQISFLNYNRMNYYRILKEQAQSYINNIKENSFPVNIFIDLHECEHEFSSKAGNTSYCRYKSEDDQFNIIPYFHAEEEFRCIWGPNEIITEYYQKFLELINSAPDVNDDFDFETAHSALTYVYDLFIKCIFNLGDEYEHAHYNADNVFYDDYKIIKEYIDKNGNIPGMEEDIDIDSEYNKIKKYIDMGFKKISDLWYASLKLGLKQGKSLETLNFTMAKYGKKAFEKIIGVKNPEPVFTLSDGQQVKLTAQDLLFGAYLGMTTIEEIGKVILKHGTLNPNELL